MIGLSRQAFIQALPGWLFGSGSGSLQAFTDMAAAPRVGMFSAVEIEGFTTLGSVATFSKLG